MRNSDLALEEDPPTRSHTGSLSPEEFRELSPKDFQEEEERARQVAELVSALRNFAVHFGAEEVYQQAKVIYAETPEGKAGIEREAAQIVQHSGGLRGDDPFAPERPRKTASARPQRNESRSLAEARRALGG